MKLENLLFSLFIVFLAITALAITGWGVTFLMGVEFTLKDGQSYSDTRIFLSRAFIGCFFIGMITGMFKLFDLFKFCMVNAPTRPK